MARRTFLRTAIGLLLFPFSVLTAAACSGNDAALCAVLESKFKELTFLSGETEYPALRTENWSETAWRTPTCIFRPSSVEELQHVVPLLVDAGVRFAIRSGGHSISPWAANIDRGVLIDLSEFDQVVYDSARSVAKVGSGQRWENVYRQLDQFNVTVVGGRVLGVGVGGFILGGGLSYLSDLYGLSCDNVVNFEVILASGRLVDANATSNPDLFWALKGGANNFGIVTSFTLSTYPIKEVWGGVKGYALEDLPALHAAMLEYQTTSPKDPYANLMLQGFVTNATLGIVLNVVYLKPEVSPAAFAPFDHINTTFDTTTLSTFSEFLQSQGAAELPPRIDWFATSFAPSEPLYNALNSLVTRSDALEQIRSVTSGSVAFGLQPISASVVEAGKARGGNPLGLESANQTWYVLDSGWWSPDDDEAVHAATGHMIGDIEAVSRAADSYTPYIFMNDASWDQDVIRHYGENNVRRLRAVRQRYDPRSVFKRLVPGGFKIP